MNSKNVVLLLVLVGIVQTSQASESQAAPETKPTQVPYTPLYYKNQPTVSIPSSDLLPFNATAAEHYAKANELSTQGKQFAALIEYRTALKYTNDPKMKEYCLEAIKAWSQPRSSETVAVNEIQNQAQALDSQRYGQNSYTDKYQKMSTDEIRNAIQDLERQKEQKLSDYTRDQKTPITDQGAAARNIQREFDGQITSLKQILEQRAFGQQVQDLKNVVQNSATDKGTSPKVNPFGTNLFIRNYAYQPQPTPKPQTDPEELVAAPERLILDSHSHPGKTITRVTQEKIPEQKPQPNSVLKVQGKLVP